MICHAFIRNIDIVFYYSCVCICRYDLPGHIDQPQVMSQVMGPFDSKTSKCECMIGNSRH